MAPEELVHCDTHFKVRIRLTDGTPYLAGGYYTTPPAEYAYTGPGVPPTLFGSCAEWDRASVVEAMRAELPAREFARWCADPWVRERFPV